jgi:hypothetical protein
MRLLVERGRSAEPIGADHVRTRRGGIETVSHELTEPSAKGISRADQIRRLVAPVLPVASVGSTASQWEVLLGPLVDVDTMPHRPSGQPR